MQQQNLFLDEEDCLGAELFTSELELLVGSTKLRGRLDQVQLLELLPKLAATIPKADRATLKVLQKKCEPAFTEMIGLGVCTTVRRLIAVCLTRFYMHGDALGIYSRVHSLQTCLMTREAGPKGLGVSGTWQQLMRKGGAAGAAAQNGQQTEAGELSDSVRAGMLDLLAHLSLHHGRFLASAAATNMVISKNGCKSSSKLVRVAALRLAASTVEGLHPRDRTVPEVQAEAFALFQRSAKEHSCEDTQIAAAALVCAIARGGGSALWIKGGANWEEALRLSCVHVSHPCQAVRDGYALALCDLSVAVNHEVLEDVIKTEKKAAKKAALTKLRTQARGEVLQRTLVQPLVSEALQGNVSACASLSLAWTSYIGYVAAQIGESDDDLVEIAVQVVQLCDTAAAKAQAQPKSAAGNQPETHLGEALASGELPHVQACALYIMRSAVIEALAESSQKALLQRLVGLLVRPGCAVPTAVVALEGLCILMDVLGEVGEEEGGTLLEAAIMSQVPSPSTAVRHQAASAAAALASVQPPSAARLLGGVLDTLEAASQLMAEMRPAQTAAAPPAFTTLMSKTPAALAATAHGAALAAAGLLMVAAQLPLSIPSILPRRALALATQLIRQPNSDSIISKCTERESGYIVLGALICSWEGVGEEAGVQSSSASAASTAPAANDSKLPSRAEDAVLGLLSVAAGNTAREELGDAGYAGQDGEINLSSQLRWRSVALQALHACMVSWHAKGSLADVSPQMKHASLCLSQLLAVVETQRYLQEPTRSMGGPSGPVAAHAATFQLRLLQCLRLLPVDQLQPASLKTLIGLCSYPVRMASIAVCGSLSVSQAPLPLPSLLGLQTGAMEVLYQTMLRHVLEKEDSVLGPWPLGRDTAEDELHAFAGEHGGPHQLPWESPLLHILCADKRSLSGGGYNPNGSGHSPQDALQKMMAHGTVHASSDAGGSMRKSLYPQPIGLGPALLAAQVAVLGQLLSQASPDDQLHILDDCIHCASAGKAGAVRRVGGKDGATTMMMMAHTQSTTTPGLKPAEQDAAARRLGASTLAAIVALSGLMPIVRQPPSARAAMMGSAEVADKVASRVLQLANALLDGGGASEPGIARSGAQMLAASACLGSDSWAGKVVSAISDEVTGSAAEGRDQKRRSALCLALSSVHRAKGGLVLQALIPSSTAALVVAARHHTDSDVALWALHSLTIMAQSTGPGYMQHVHSTFTLCRELLVSSYEATGLRPMCARLANAMVGVLGPEFSLGSSHYAAAKSLITDLAQAGVLAVDDPQALMALCTVPGASNNQEGNTAESPQVAPRPITVEALACELQAVLFAQQLILFAPKAIQASKHVPMLQITLLSRRPALRKAAAATLRHLAERDPHMLLSARLEGALFASLDGEANAAIAGQLRATLEALLVVGAPQRPSYWLACLAEVVFSSGGKAGGAGQDAGTGTGDVDSEKEDENADDQEDEEGGRRQGGAEGRKGRGKAAKGQANGDANTAGELGKRQSIGAVVGTGNGGENKAGRGAAKGGKAKAERQAHMAAAAAAGVEGAGTMQALLATVALRLRTRVFAAELVHRMLQVAERRCAADPLELVPTRALDRSELDNQEANGHNDDVSAQHAEVGSSHIAHRDKMVDHLQEFIEVGYKISIGPVEALKPCGVWLLHAVLRVYGGVEDPLLPGARLLENHQAYLVGALRASLAPATSAAGPVLAIAGGQLATTFLESSLAAGDSKVMRRLLELLTSPLSSGSGLRAAGGAYVEWVGTVHTLALLQAHAQCAIIARQEGNELVLQEVSAAHQHYRTLLCALWAALLQDHAILSTQPPPVLHAYPSALLTVTSTLADNEEPTLATTDSSSRSDSGDLNDKESQHIPRSHSAAALAAALSGNTNNSVTNGTTSNGGSAHTRTASGSIAAPHMRVYRGFRSMAVAAAQARGGGDGRNPGAIMSSRVVRRVRAAYMAAAPVVLRALNLGYLPDAHQVAASRDGNDRESGTLLHRQYCVLLDVALIMVSDTARALAHAVQACMADGCTKEGSDITTGASALESSIRGLHGLMGVEHFGADLVASAVLLQALREVKGVVHTVLAPMQWAVIHCGATGWAVHVASLVQVTSAFLKELAQGTPSTMLSDTASGIGSGVCHAFVDGLLATASITSPFTLLPPTEKQTEQTHSSHANQQPSSSSHTALQQQSHHTDSSLTLSREDGHMAVAPLLLPAQSQAQQKPSTHAPVFGGLPLQGTGSQAGAAADGFLVQHKASYARQTNTNNQCKHENVLACDLFLQAGAAAGGSLVSLLVAAQGLIRKADQQQQPSQHQQEQQQDAGPLAQLLPPLLYLSVRLLASAPPGVQLTAAHRFFDTQAAHAHTAAERIASSADASTSAHDNSDSNDSDSTQGQHEAGEHSANSKSSDSSAAAALMLGAEGAVLCVARALRAGVRELRLTCDENGTEEGVRNRGEESREHSREQEHVSPSSNQQQGEGSQANLHGEKQTRAVWSVCDFCTRGPVYLSVAMAAVGHLCSCTRLEHQLTGSQSSERVLPSFVVGVLSEVMGLRGSHSHSDAAEGSQGAAHAAAVDALQLKAVEGLRLALQEGNAAAVAAAAEGAAQPGKAVWAQQVLHALGPLVSDLAHARMHANADAQQQQQQPLSSNPNSGPPHSQRLIPLSSGSVAVVSECLKALVAAANFVGGSQGADGQVLAFQVLLPLLVMAAAPAPPALPTLALKELAVKLITSLPGSPRGAAFKVALSSLPQASKQQLQSALREPEVGLVLSQAGRGTTPTAVLASPARQRSTTGGAAASRPAIQLKTTFALPTK